MVFRLEKLSFNKKILKNDCLAIVGQADFASVKAQEAEPS